MVVVHALAEWAAFMGLTPSMQPWAMHGQPLGAPVDSLGFKVRCDRAVTIVCRGGVLNSIAELRSAPALNRVLRCCRQQHRAVQHG